MIKVKHAILKYHGPTNHRGSRMSVTFDTGKRFYFPYDAYIDSLPRQAAATFHWPDNTVYTETRGGYIVLFPYP